MTLFPSTRSIVGASTRHPWRTLGMWVVLIVLAGFLAASMGTKFSDDGDFTNNPESKQADTLLAQHSDDDPSTETVVVRSDQWTVDDPAFQTVVQTTSANLAAMTGVVASVNDYYQLTAAGVPDAGQLVSQDRHVTLLNVVLAGDADDLIDHGADFVATAQGQHGNGFEVYAVGDLSGNEAYSKIADEDLGKSEKVGLPVALLVLIVVFGGAGGASAAAAPRHHLDLRRGRPDRDCLAHLHHHR